MDVIEDDLGITMILQQKGTEKLSSIMSQNLISSSISIGFARDVMIKLAKILDKMHQKKVMHRSLSQDSIMMSYKDEYYKVSSIQDFDTSYHLKSRWMVR